MSIESFASISANLIAVAAAVISCLAWVLAKRTGSKFRRPLWVCGPDLSVVKTVAIKLRASGYKSVTIRPFEAPLDPSSLPVLVVPDKFDAMPWWISNGQPEYGVVYCPGRANKPEDWIASNSIPVSLPMWVGAAIEARWPA